MLIRRNSYKTQTQYKLFEYKPREEQDEVGVARRTCTDPACVISYCSALVCREKEATRSHSLAPASPPRKLCLIVLLLAFIIIRILFRPLSPRNNVEHMLMRSSRRTENIAVMMLWVRHLLNIVLGEEGWWKIKQGGKEMGGGTRSRRRRRKTKQ